MISVYFSFKLRWVLHIYYFILSVHKLYIYKYYFNVQAHNAVMDALLPNVPAYHTSHPFLLFNADLHDIQHLALFRSSFGCYPWLLPFRMEEICNCGRYRTLSLVIDIVA